MQSGFIEPWWADAMDCASALLDVDLRLQDGQTSYEKRTGKTFEWLVIPFGAHVKYKPSSEADIARTHSYGDKLLNGLFAGYYRVPGGGI